MSKFRKGAEAAQEASKGNQFARTHYFGLEDGKTTILRFLTDADDWPVVDQHQMVPTKGAPEGYEGKWPTNMGAVCRNDPAFNGVYSECYVCDFVVDGSNKPGHRKPGARTWALACLREEVIGDGSDELGGAANKGRVIGVKDVTRDVTIPAKDGNPEKTVTEKAIVVVNMGYKNFFSILKGFAGRYGTVLDRDYHVKRDGAATDTTYAIVPLDPIDTSDGRLDLRDPKFAERYQTNLDLEGVISEHASDQFYAKFFDPRFSVSKESDVKKTGKEVVPATPETDISAERMAALADRVKGYGVTKSDAPKNEEAPVPAAIGGGMRDF